MAKRREPGERAEVGDVRGEYLEILKLCAALERAYVRKRIHRHDEHLKLRHAFGKAETVDRLVMAEVYVLHLRAVFELVHLGVVQNAADGGLGGQNAVSIRAHAVELAEPDAPHNVHLRELVADSLHTLIRQSLNYAAVIHVERLAVFQRRKRLHGGCAVVGDLYAAEVYRLIGEGEALPVKREGIRKFRLRAGLDEHGDVRPAELCRILTSKLHAGEALHAGEVFRDERRVTRVDTAEVERRLREGVGRVADREAVRKALSGARGLKRGEILRREGGGAHVAAAEIDRFHHGQVFETGRVFLERVMPDAGEVDGLRAVFRLRAAGQGHVIIDLHLRMRRGPGVYLLHTGAAAEVRRLQGRELGELCRLPIVQDDGDGGGVLFEAALLKGDGVRDRGQRPVEGELRQPRCAAQNQKYDVYDNNDAGKPFALHPQTSAARAFRARRFLLTKILITYIKINT